MKKKFKTISSAEPEQFDRMLEQAVNAIPEADRLAIDFSTSAVLVPGTKLAGLQGMGMQTVCVYTASICYLEHVKETAAPVEEKKSTLILEP